MKKSYSGLLKLNTVEERFLYLKIGGVVGEDTFGYSRGLNQEFYRSDKWRGLRREIIIRDNGNEMAIPDLPIVTRIHVHHIVPITIKDILYDRDIIWDPENLVCVSEEVHRAIHYGADFPYTIEYVERRPGDTKLW